VTLSSSTATISESGWFCQAREKILLLSRKARFGDAVPLTDRRLSRWQRIHILSEREAAFGLVSFGQLQHYLASEKIDFDEMLHSPHSDFPLRVTIGPQIPLEKTHRTLGIFGLGRVGTAMLQAVTILPASWKKIYLFDRTELRLEQLVFEMNQVALPGRSFPEISRGRVDDYQHCDVLAFAASAPIPPLGSESKGDVRLRQYTANGEILRKLLDSLDRHNFRGKLAVVSDPVEHLTRLAVLHKPAMMREADFFGLGLGVMYARARYFARRRERHALHVCGTHGDLLEVINHPLRYSPERSQQLTAQVRGAHLQMRKLGYIPFIAPALSSAALSLQALSRCRPFFASAWNGTMVWGSKLVPLPGAWGWWPYGQKPELIRQLRDNRFAVDKQYHHLPNFEA
jgi:hypothetical protein